MKGPSMKKHKGNHTDVGTRSQRLSRSVNLLAFPSLVVKRAKTLDLEWWWWRSYRVTRLGVMATEL